eukprot:scaffold91_cov254-Pinguiococcus_pyrenoidosus.AAC.29
MLRLRVKGTSRGGSEHDFCASIAAPRSARESMEQVDWSALKRQAGYRAVDDYVRRLDDVSSGKLTADAESVLWIAAA